MLQGQFSNNGCSRVSIEIRALFSCQGSSDQARLKFCPKQCHNLLMDHTKMVPVYGEHHFCAVQCSAVQSSTMQYSASIDEVSCNGHGLGQRNLIEFCGFLGPALGCKVEIYCTLLYVNYLYCSLHNCTVLSNSLGLF